MPKYITFEIMRPENDAVEAVENLFTELWSGGLGLYLRVYDDAPKGESEKYELISIHGWKKVRLE